MQRFLCFLGIHKKPFKSIRKETDDGLEIEELCSSCNKRMRACVTIYIKE